VASLAVPAILAPLLAPYDPGVQVATPFAPPTWRNHVAANDIGQDLLSELIYVRAGVAAHRRGSQR